jgi:hypothetical protein
MQNLQLPEPLQDDDELAEIAMKGTEGKIFSKMSERLQERADLVDIVVQGRFEYLSRFPEGSR